MTVFGLELPVGVVLAGVMTGMTYGLLAVGLVLVYQSSRVVNLAHGAIGGFAAAVLGLAVVQWGLPYWVAFAFALAVGAATAGVVEAAVVRRLRKAPRTMGIVATLGFAQFLFLLVLAVFSQVRAGTVYPKPPGFPEFRVAGFLVTQAHSAMLILSPLIIGALFLFLHRTSYGVAIRAASANPDNARLTAISPSRMSLISWGLAGALATFTATLVMPTLGFLPVEQLGPSLLLRALVGAVMARMSSLPRALATGVLVGVVEAVVFFNVGRGGLVEILLFGAVLASLLTQHRQGVRERDGASWATTQPWAPLPDRIRAVPAVRLLVPVLVVAALAVAVVLPAFVSNASAIKLVAILCAAIIGLSLSVITGLGGELSLGQVAVAGFGGLASYYVVLHTGNFFLAFVGAGMAGAATSALIGLPALRIRGLMLSVTTLSFALATEQWVLQQDWAFGVGVEPGRPIIGSVVFEGSKPYYFLTLVVLVLMLWLTRNVRSSGFGRALVALRDNEEAARAFTIHATRRKLQGFAYGGFVAGIGGALFTHSLARVAYDDFPVARSIEVAAMTIIGGLSLLVGPLLGALYVLGVPAFVPLDAAGLAGSSLGWLLLLLYLPGGLAQLVAPLRERVIARLAGTTAGAGVDARVAEPNGREAGDEPPRAVALAPLPLSTPPMATPASDDGRARLLVAEGVGKTYGGVAAVNDVSLHVGAGEIVGLIGPNGAGKTTLFDVLSGFTKPDHGTVVFAGHDVSRASPERRGELGLIRSFQNGALFETLTVLETVTLAMERVAPTRLHEAAFAFSGRDRRKREQAREIVHMMGLERYAHVQARELSTGTRRIVELACLLALQPRLLLLDEPSSGIAQRETEAMGELLLSVAQALGAGILLIEHDIPLVMRLSDRVVAMAEGRVIADGPPSVVRKDPTVVEAYLGADAVAIERSDDAGARRRASAGRRGTTMVDERCVQVTLAGTPCTRRAVDDGRCRQHADQAG